VKEPEDEEWMIDNRTQIKPHIVAEAAKCSTSHVAVICQASRDNLIQLRDDGQGYPFQFKDLS